MFLYVAIVYPSHCYIAIVLKHFGVFTFPIKDPKELLFVGCVYQYLLC